ncbi:sugar-binding transcriptional regulator [Salinisphaera sp. USBA-960]|nr:sugar-binding transcriptional regulator [Salifodinibacter halophilus]NNC26866.1 sugar-binding transcriptional regulator [Salifodinibacter halophilus]
MSESDRNKDLSIQIAWMAYIGGHTQASIAERYGLSRAKVNRLISQAHESGYVHVFIDHSPQRLIEMGDRIAAQYGLGHCTVVPEVETDASSHGSVAALGSAAAYYLTNRLNHGDIRTLGVSWGRSLAEMARRLPRERRPNLAVASVMGSLTLKSAINPFDVVHRITDIIDASGFFIPVPFIADSVADRDVLIQQRSVHDALERARQAELCCVGIGAIRSDQPMFMADHGLLAGDEQTMLTNAGAVGELVGRFVDVDGNEVDVELNRRILGLSIDELRARETVAVAGGVGKIDAIRAVLNTGALSGLIVDENAADQLCESAEADGHDAVSRGKSGLSARNLEEDL